MSEFFERLVETVYSNLKKDCPVLSGNMKAHIKIIAKDSKNAIIEISGPTYDMTELDKNGVFEYVGGDYAYSVNKKGAFGGRSTKSKGWVNRSLINSCNSVAPSLNAEVKVKL